ncbi:hypothetical protein ACTJIV_00760 [Chryseobacterium sp. 22532]|uniref:hypothetical protein n=1 Tax=Chryseobacterium sp. 22532 TaxID=3453938 RepID=UPI003F867B8C
MNKNTIEYLAYLLDKAHKEKGREKAIVFLGAGTSVSAGIPLTNTIVRHIRIKFYNNPIIKECIKIKKDDYYSLMGALTADERRDLFHFYVTRKSVKLNITNIYLAQLLKLGYVDYIVTVNFDDLILRACTLYNFLPAVYDISNIKTITTTDIRKKSVIYLHGQYFGQWLLNNPDELQKVEDEVLRLFNAIKTRRTWIIVGYSGNDGIFNKIKSLGSFSNELFWVKNKFYNTDKKVVEFIETSNINAHRIEGYYSDDFFLKLHSELSKLDNKLCAPEIISQPFTFIKSVLQSINEISEGNELNNNVKHMLTLCNERIDKAINKYEKEGTVENLKQRIVEAILKGNFNDELAQSFENEINEKNYEEAFEQLGWYYIDWGTELLEVGNYEKNKQLIKKSIEKFEKSSQLMPSNEICFYNWGNALYYLARMDKDGKIFEECFKIYEKASLINPNDASIYNNWGNSLCQLGTQLKKENLFIDAIKKHEIALSLEPKNGSFLFNWGNTLYKLGSLTSEKGYFEKSISKFKEAAIASPNESNIFYSLGIALASLAGIEGDESIYNEGLEKIKIAIELKPNHYDYYIGLGQVLSNLALLKEDINLFDNSVLAYEKALELAPENIQVLDKLSNVLINLSYFDNKRREFILSRAKEVSEKRYYLDGDVYNLVRSSTLLGQKETALKYIQETLDEKTIVLPDIEE